jgi:hypothetical protein
VLILGFCAIFEVLDFAGFVGVGIDYLANCFGLRGVILWSPRDDSSGGDSTEGAAGQRTADRATCFGR